MRSKIAILTCAAAVLTVGIATADAAHKPAGLAIRHAHAPHHSHVVVHAPGGFKLPGSAVACRVGPACSSHHHPPPPPPGDPSDQPGDADHSGDGGGGPETRNCLDDGCRQWQN